MDDDAHSIDSPALSNPGTPLMAQVSNPSTPRNDDVTISQVVPPNTTATSIITITTSANNPPIITLGSSGNNNGGGGAGGGGGGGAAAATAVGTPANLLLQVVPPGGGPGCVPQGSSITQSTAATCVARQPQSKYAQLLAVIEDLGKDIRPTYAGSKSSAERLKRGIVHARILTTPAVTFKTQFNADTVEWCPNEPHEDFLVCGTYELLKDDPAAEDQRVGCIYLLQVQQDNNDRMSLKILHQVTSSAVLDTRWCNHNLNGHSILATVNADGRLVLYSLEQEESEYHLKMLTQSADEDALALALDWSTVKHHSCQPLIAVGNSKGYASVFRVENNLLTMQESWKAHDYEAWVVAFDYWTPTTVYTGGDDCLFKGWDLRASTRFATFNSRHHSMGVTSIQKHPWNSHSLVSGSYDERVLFWDVRHMKGPTSEVQVGGGVWRLKWMKDNEQHLLAACMHGGASVISGEFPSKVPKVVLTYARHESMVYGIDWCRRPEAIKSSNTSQNWVATCSFYDRALHLWNFENPSSPIAGIHQ